MQHSITIELTRDEDRDEDTGALRRPGNGQVFIEPLEESRRGRWRKNQHMPPEARTDPRIAHAPEELPGYRVMLDIDDRTVTVFDPLGEGAVRERMVAVFRDHLGRRLDFEKPIEHKKLSDEQLWDWVKWMRRALVDKDARLIKGQFPKRVDERLKQERQWDLETDPETGRKQWQPAGALAG